MNSTGRINAAAFFNLLVPGAGIILLGSTWAGLLVGLVFVVCVNWALWAVLLVSDDFSPWLRGLAIGVAGGTYFGAQVRFAQTLRDRRHRVQQTRRHTALVAVRERLRQEDYAGALNAIAAVRDYDKHDLLVAHRLAQIFTGLGDVDAALRAWRQVRALDCHHIYRDEVRANEQRLADRRTAPFSRPPSGTR